MVKRVTAYVLISLIVISTTIGLLAIWDIIDVHEIMRKVLSSIFVVFIASVVVLFIFSVIIKEGDKK
jgi:succinate dehydrogenase hydrophobic anchor subunit